MRRSTRAGGALRAAAAVAVVASCRGEAPVAGPVDPALVGQWETAREPLAPNGSWQRTLTARADGRVVWRGVSYGLYPGQRPDEVSADVTLHGRLTRVGGALVIRPDSLVTHDHALGPAHRDVQRVADDPAREVTRYTLAGDTLLIRDDAMPAAEVLSRVRRL